MVSKMDMHMHDLVFRSYLIVASLTRPSLAMSLPVLRDAETPLVAMGD